MADLAPGQYPVGHPYSRVPEGPISRASITIRDTLPMASRNGADHSSRPTPALTPPTQRSVTQELLAGLPAPRPQPTRPQFEGPDLGPEVTAGSARAAVKG